MDAKLPNKNFFSNNFIDVSVCCCNNFCIGYNFDNIFTMQTQETQNTSNQSYFKQIKEVGTLAKQEDVTTACTCKIQFYIILALSITMFGQVMFAVLCSWN